MKSTLFTLTSIILIVVLSASSAHAHHGLEYYDTSKFIEIEGKVVDFELSTPHSFLYVESVDSDGNIRKWEIEGGAASGVAKAGLTKQFLSTHPYVKVKAYQSKGGYCYPTCKAAGRDFDFDRE